MEQKRQEFLQAQGLNFDIYELLINLSDRFQEFEAVSKKIKDLDSIEPKFMRPKIVESVYGIKRTTLENHARNQVLNKYKLFGCVVYSVEEIEHNIIRISAA